MILNHEKNILELLNIAIDAGKEILNIYNDEIVLCDLRVYQIRNRLDVASQTITNKYPSYKYFLNFLKLKHINFSKVRLFD